MSKNSVSKNTKNVSQNTENVRAALDSEIGAGTMTERGTRRNYDWDRLAFQARNRRAVQGGRLREALLTARDWAPYALVGGGIALLIVGAVVGLSWAVGMLARAGWAEGWIGR